MWLKRDISDKITKNVAVQQPARGLELFSLGCSTPHHNFDSLLETKFRPEPERRTITNTAKIFSFLLP